MKPSKKRLACTVTRDGVLRIEIGIETLGMAAIHSPIVDKVRRNALSSDVTVMHRGLAQDVKRALLDEGEDGSNRITRMLDDAFEEAYEQGSEHFSIKGDE